MYVPAKPAEQFLNVSSLRCGVREVLQFRDGKLNQGVPRFASSHITINAAQRVVCPGVLNMRFGLVRLLTDYVFERGNCFEKGGFRIIILTEVAMQVAHSSKGFGHPNLGFGATVPLYGQLFVECQHSPEGIKHATCFVGIQSLSWSPT